MALRQHQADPTAMFSVADIARALGVSHQRVYQLIQGGKIEPPAAGRGYTLAQFTHVVQQRRRVQRAFQEMVKATR